MVRSRRNVEFGLVAVFILFAWYLFDAQFNDIHNESVEASFAKKPWRYEATEAEEQQKTLEPSIAHGGTNEEISSTSTTPQHTSTLTQSTAIALPSPLLPDRIVVLAKLPTEDISWVHTDLPDWQSAIYNIDTDIPHNAPGLDPLTNSTLRTLRNKGKEANAYLAYIVQNYNNLPSTIAFIHPHKDGYPVAWHTDNEEHSNMVSLQTLNIDFVQTNGYANLRCVLDPGCPAEVQPFRDPPEHHRATEYAMPEAWRDLFDNKTVPQILATPCCAQFAVSSKQVRKRPLEVYRKYYTWLMDTPLDDDTSGRVLEYLWHVFFGKEPV